MTDPRPTPPPELVQQWAQYHDLQEPEALWRTIATQASRWAADQELEACCEWLEPNYSGIEYLRAARRPQPEPTLKKRALALVSRRIGDGFVQMLDQGQADTIRRALEQLPEGPAVTPPPAIVKDSLTVEPEPAAAPDRPLWEQVANAWLSRPAFDADRSAAVLRVVADWIEALPAHLAPSPESVVRHLRAEAERAENPNESI